MVWIGWRVLDGGEEGGNLPHVAKLVGPCVAVEHSCTFHTVDSQQGLQSGHHLLNALLEVGPSEFEQLGQPLDFLVEESVGPLLAELDDGLGFAIMEGLGVLGAEHVEDRVDEGREGKL
jgi:hypothetical protein